MSGDVKGAKGVKGAKSASPPRLAPLAKDIKDIKDINAPRLMSLSASPLTPGPSPASGERGKNHPT